MIGETLGHYRVVERIGQGGMGVVYRAHDERLERDVALKVLPVGALANDTARKRFRSEALALSKFNHPNVATVYDFDSQQGVDFLVMELIRGVALGDKLSTGPLDEKEAARLGAQLADGLAAAHAQGVVHRDLKPSNILITVDGWLKILDFGVAKFLQSKAKLLEVSHSETDLAPWAEPQEAETTDRLAEQLSATETRTVTGTLPYMSPEQLRGEPTDARCDIWALGIVLFEMVSGALPFKARTGFELSSKILREPPTPVPPHVSAGLRTIIERCLRKDPGHRYQRASEVRAALEAVGSGSLIVPGERRTLLYRRVSAAVLVLGLLLAALFVLNVGGWRERASPTRDSAKSTVPSQPRSAASRRSVAILGFKNLSGKTDTAYLSDVFSRMLTTELAGEQTLQTVPGENVGRMKAEVSLPDEDSFAKDTLTQIRSRLGTDFIVHGSYVTAGGKVRLDLRLQDTANADIVIAVSEIGSESELLDLVSRSGARLREALEIVKAGVEQQQHDLMAQANYLADKQDFKDAIAKIDEALKLNGSLNADLQKLRQALQAGIANAKTWSEEEKILGQATAAFNQGEWTNAESAFKKVLAINGGRRQLDAQRYISELIPARMQEEKYMTDAKRLANSSNPADLQTAKGMLETVVKLDGPRKAEARSLLTHFGTKLDKLSKDALIQGAMAAGRDALIRGDFNASRRSADDIKAQGGDPSALLGEVSSAESNRLNQLIGRFNSLRGGQDTLQLQALQGEVRRFLEASGNQTARALAENQIPAAIRRIVDQRVAEAAATRVSLPSDTSKIPAALLKQWPCPPIPVGAALGGSLPLTPKPGQMVAAEMLDAKPAWTSCAMPDVSGTGTVRLSLEIDEKGNVTNVRPRGPVNNQQLFDAVAAAAKSWKVPPLRAKGIPVKTSLAYDIQFK